jgi:hypothetical protein
MKKLKPGMLLDGEKVMQIGIDNLLIDASRAESSVDIEYLHEDLINYLVECDVSSQYKAVGAREGVEERMDKFIEENSDLMDMLDDKPESKYTPVSKDTKAAQGVHKVSTHVIPTQVLLELGLALTEGSLKYGGARNWRANKVLASVYYDAFNRHMMRWFNGEAVDKDSGVSHLVKAMANLTILRDAELSGALIDDRDKNPVDFDAIDAKAAALFEKCKKK